MQHNFQFSNLLAASYRGGSVEFGPDGNSLLAPNGNRAALLDLVHGRSLTLQPENRRNVALLTLSPDARLLLSIDDQGHSLLINFAAATVLQRVNFRKKVQHAAWSPDSKWLAVGVGRYLQLWKAPSLESGWVFVKYRTLGGHRGDIFKLCWSGDSKYVLTGAEDMQVRLYSVYDGEVVTTTTTAMEGKQEVSRDEGEKRSREEMGGEESESSGSEEEEILEEEFEELSDLENLPEMESESEEEKSSSESSAEEGRAPDVGAKTGGQGDATIEQTTAARRLGRIVPLSGQKGKTTFGGFKPMIFAELRQPVRGAYFSEDKKTVFCVCKDGVVATWRFNLEEKTSLEEKIDWEKDFVKKDVDVLRQPGSWTCASKAFMNLPGGNKITDTAFNAKTNMLLAGLTGGIFVLYELLPKVASVHTLSIGVNPIDRVAISPSGEWIAAASSVAGQLLVWEWQSETYVIKQQSHHWGVKCAAFAPAGGNASVGSKSSREGAGQHNHSLGILATGGYDGKIKLWNAGSGLNFLTFAEHTAEINDLVFTPQGNAVLSASADGSVRAFDLLRYRNFRTFVAPASVKSLGFEGVAVDGGGEIVAAAVRGESYAVLVWSLQTGKLLETLTGHEAPISCLRFSTNPGKPGELATGSWDGNLTVQDVFARTKGAAPERLHSDSSVVAVAFDPRGNNIVAAAGLAGHITFWNTDEGKAIGNIEGIRDVLSGRDATSQIAANNTRGKTKKEKHKFWIEHVNLNQHFSSIDYSAAGSLLLACSRNSPHVCLYSTSEFTLVHRLTLTRNESLTGLKVLLNSGKSIVDGEVMAEFDLSDSEEADHLRKRRRIAGAAKLPGVVSGELSSKKNDRFHCFGCGFSGDGRALAVATSHGLYYYESGKSSAQSLQTVIGGTALDSFRPALLTKNVSLPNILEALERGELTKAFLLALALQDSQILERIYAKIPVESVSSVVQSVGSPLLPALIHFLAGMLKPEQAVGRANAVGCHLRWLEAVLDNHLTVLLSWTSGDTKKREGEDVLQSGNKISGGDLQALLLTTLQQCSSQYANLSSVFEGNAHALTYLAGRGGGGRDGAGAGE